MTSLIRKINFQIDQRYVAQARKGGSFSPLRTPGIFIWYILSLASKINPKSENHRRLIVKNSPSTSWKSSILAFFGHTYFPGKLSLSDLPGQEICESPLKFNSKANPDVTILLVFDKNVDDFSRCLRSIAASSEETNIELILIGDESTGNIRPYLDSNIEGAIRYHVPNQGELVTTLNRAIFAAKGEFFSIIQSSIFLKTDWLKELLLIISKDQGIGAVGGKVLSSDGLLDEAGNFVDGDLHLQKYGKWDFPNRPKYNFIREIECSEGSNTLFRKTDFAKIGGFDASLQPLTLAFCKFSLALRGDLNKRVVYTPLAEVVRSGLVNPDGGLDVSSLSLPDVEEKNSNGRSLDPDNNARRLLTDKNVLFIDVGLPEPDRDSGSLRAFYLFKLLKELNYHVILVPRKGQANSPYHEDYIRMGIEVLYAFPGRKGMKRELSVLLPSIDLAWICRPQLNAEFEWIFEINPKIKWIYDTIDLHFVRLAREAELSNSKKLMRKSARFKKLEFSIATKADLTLTVTEDEKKMLEDQGVKNIAVIPNIHEPQQHDDYPGFLPRKGLLFIGSYHHPPNVDAVKWLVEGIMPIVWEKLRIPVTLLGNAPGKEVKALESELVKVPGYVKDVEPFFTSHRVFVAPLRYGAGMKGKIGQSLTYNLPIVTTAIGAEGVGLTHGLDVLIADDKESFAQQIINVYQDEQLWRDLACNSEKVLSSYSPNQISKKLQAIIEGLL